MQRVMSCRGTNRTGSGYRTNQTPFQRASVVSSRDRILPSRSGFILAHDHYDVTKGLVQSGHLIERTISRSPFTIRLADLRRDRP